MNPETYDQKNLRVVNLSLASNLLLAVAKTAAGILGHSSALLADGINSIADVVYLTIVRIFMKMAGKAPDREHPYGHRQLESVAAVIVGAFVIATGFAIFWEAIQLVYTLLTHPGEGRSATAVALWVALLTIMLKVCLTLFATRVAKETKSLAILALARDHRNDIISISAATVGIVLNQAGYLWVDPAAAAFVAIVIFWTGITILRESSADLMRVLPNEPIRERIRELIASIPGVQTIEEVRVHRIGMYLLVSITVGVDGRQTVVEGDQIANEVERMLYEKIEYLRHVSVHYHPSKRRGGDRAINDA